VDSRTSAREERRPSK